MFGDSVWDRAGRLELGGGIVLRPKAVCSFTNLLVPRKFSGEAGQTCQTLGQGQMWGRKPGQD